MISLIEVLTVVFFAMGTIALIVRIIVLPAPISSISNNTDSEAIEKTKDLANLAKESIDIFDDGDGKGESVYNDLGFVDMMESKVDNDSLRVKCFFNERDVSGLKFVERLAKKEGVEIWTRKAGQDRPQDMHYRIIDGGKVAHLSKHTLGSGDRQYEVLDCSSLRALPRHYHKLMLKIHYKQREKNFDRLESGAANA